MRRTLSTTGLVGSTTAGVFEFDTSSASIGDRYPMNVRIWRLVDRLSASSDFELKLVTIWSFRLARLELFGTSSVLTNQPDGVSSSRKIFDVMPKLPSMGALLNTVGYVPSYFATTQFAGAQLGG